MADKVKDVAIEEAERVKQLTRDAARSGAYLYPVRVRTRCPPWLSTLNKEGPMNADSDFQGIAYFASHKSLWCGP